MRLAQNSENESRIVVSIVLNCHNEDSYLTSTLQSLDQAAACASQNGYGVELISILDNPTELTEKIVSSFKSKYFIKCRCYCVSYGSLGLSRNAGILKAHGEYILTADADDLVSENYIAAAIKFASRNDTNSAFFPMYVYSFGLKHGITRYASSEFFSPCDLVFYHPYCSRIFISKKNLSALLYSDVNSKSGFAFEDWDLNRRLFQLGIKLLPIPDTILFYRQRENSIMNQGGNLHRIPPPSTLLDPTSFMSLYFGYKRPKDFDKLLSWDPVKEVRSSEFLRELLIKANRIDPTITIETEGHKRFLSLRSTDSVHSHWGYRLPALFLLSGASKYDTVCVLPWLEPGGGEKYILQILEQISSLSKKNRILVLAVESNGDNVWRDKLPENAIFLNYSAFTSDLSADDSLSLLVTFLMAIAQKDATLHLKSCWTVEQLLSRYAKAISTHYHIYYYLFCMPWRRYFDHWVVAEELVERVRRYLPYITAYISDNKSLPSEMLRLFGEVYKEKFQATIYAYCPVRENLLGNFTNTKEKRLLWASRICSQKRVDLLQKIASQLRKLDLDVSIDIYGPIEEGFRIKETSYLKYKGKFDTFSDLDLSLYSGFIYTSAYDGVPNIILEAMANGLPVVSVIGIRSAIHEVVTDVTAWPVIDDVDDEVLVRRYCLQIQDMLKHPQKAHEKALEAQKLIMTQHSFENHYKRVKELFGLQTSEQVDSIAEDMQRIRKEIGGFLQVLPKQLPNSITHIFSQPLPLDKEITLKELNCLATEKEKSLRIRKNAITYIANLLKPYPFIFSLAKFVYRTSYVQRLLRYIR